MPKYRITVQQEVRLQRIAVIDREAESHKEAERWAESAAMDLGSTELFFNENGEIITGVGATAEEIEEEEKETE